MTGCHVGLEDDIGADFAQARERAYAGLGDITLQGAQYRTDIAAKVTR